MEGFIKKLLREGLEEGHVEYYIEKWKAWYLENVGMDACTINTGECNNFAESVQGDLEKDGVECEVLSDAFFYDPFDESEPDELWDPREFGSQPTYDYRKFGLPCHYWVYCNGKHYDSEAPEGVTNFFELPIFQYFKNKYTTQSLNGNE